MVNAQIRLSDYATTPLYNIKAVVQATGISPSTLRAWERRYHMCRPQRSESGYRLYSDRDVATIRWLKTQVDAGMAISQAVAWLEALAKEADGGGADLLPATGAVQAAHAAKLTARTAVRSFAALRSELGAALVDFNEPAAELVLAEAFALYPIEEVGEHLITPVLVEIGDRWHRNEISITREHMASNYLLHRLAGLLRSMPNLNGGPELWVGCAPGELHEAGVVLLAIYLRRAGYHVHYLGQNLPLDDLAAEVARRRPALILLGASTNEAANGLRQMLDQFAHHGSGPLIGYGGRIFVQHPELRTQIAGAYLGDTAQQAVDRVAELLNDGGLAARDRSRPTSTDDGE